MISNDPARSASCVSSLVCKVTHSLHILLLPPARRQLSLADGQVGVLLDVTKSVDEEGVGFTEWSVVKDSKGVLGLGRIRVGQENEPAT